MTIVIIEDSATQRAKLEAELRASGYTVVGARDGQAGLSACRSLPEPPEAVITDVLMPGMDGHEVCRRLKGDPDLGNVPVLVLTALTAPADVLRAVEAGADNYCTKPYQLHTLLERLERMRARAETEAGQVVLGDDRFEILGAPARLGEILVSSLTDAAARYHELEQSRAQVQRSGELREEMMRIVAHELRSPVQALLAGAAVAERNATMARELPGLVRRQGKRIERVVSDLSDWSRIEVGRLRIEPVEVDLGHLVEAVVDRMGPALANHHVRLERAGPTPVHADPQRIEQVLNNLLTNAAKYAPDAPRIDVRVHRQDSSARVEVIDQGIGIEPQALGHVFDRYFRARRGEGQAEGLGMGLYISKHLVEAHGGRIGVHSVVGSGSTFWFELPWTEPSESAG